MTSWQEERGGGLRSERVSAQAKRTKNKDKERTKKEKEGETEGATK